MNSDTAEIALLREIARKQDCQFFVSNDEKEFNKKKNDYSFRGICILLDSSKEVISFVIQRVYEMKNFSFLKELKNLASINLRNNNQTDVTFLKELKNLTSLNLSNNIITDVTFLRELKNLTSLNLSNNIITDVTFLRELKNLTSLDLSWNDKLTDVTFLKELKKLTSLNLSWNDKLTDVTFLKELKNLTSLDLSFNNLTDVTFLKELKNLTWLDLNFNDLTDVSYLKELKNLTSLDLRYNKLKDVTFVKEFKNLTSLSLSGNNLTDVSYLKELKNLTSLDLSGNNLTDVTFVKEFKNLTSLYLSGNNLTDVRFLQELKNLTSLSLSPNRLIDFTFLKELKNLTSLSLSGDNLTDVTFLKELKNLTLLSLSSPNLTDVTFVKEFKNLTSLYLSGNNLTDVTFLKELKNLTSLYLSGNNLTDVTFLKELKNLTLLDLSNNKLTDVTFLKELKNLTYVNLRKNPFTTPPKEIVQQGMEGIRNYFKQIEEQGRDYLYEAKILFVGEPGAGKTSLMKKIVDKNYQIPNKEEPETVGIQIERWKYPYPQKTDIDFTTNLWDFGGQVIQYSIHQFFFTGDSLYILLSDDRKEITNFDYWFNIIGLLGKGSPILIVLNEINKNSTFDFSLSAYQKRYKELSMDERKINLAIVDHKYYDLLEKIKVSVTSLKSVGKELPKQWIPIRNEIKKIEGENHITHQAFLDICKKYNVSSEQDIKTISSTFHTLGVFLHFENDPKLFDYIFINPQWVVDSLYTVLKDKDLCTDCGLITKQNLFELFGDKYSESEKNNLLSLMLRDKFDLCYKVEDHNNEKYLFPLLLPIEKPEYIKKWEYPETLKFRYQYRFMPKGIISRLIVRLSSLIDSKNYKDKIWRDGFEINRKRTLALIFGDENKQGLKVIDIAVSGELENKKELLGIIRNEIEKIHGTSFKNIEVEEMQPCKCSLCKKTDAEKIHYYSHELLKRYDKIKRDSIVCEISLEDVNVKELLDGVQSSKQKIKEIEELKKGMAINNLNLHGGQANFGNEIGAINRD
ncbi:MAG: leucine-rich repeat domain-containing protein [Ignavibacteria bacterium]|nr:leucine-rich repeat domain-containing protein [Ignavibacteria bacterium]